MKLTDLWNLNKLIDAMSALAKQAGTAPIHFTVTRGGWRLELVGEIRATRRE